MIKKLLLNFLITLGYALAGTSSVFISAKDYKSYYLDKDLYFLKKKNIELKTYGIYSGAAKFVLGYFESLYVPTTAIPPGTKFRLGFNFDKNNGYIENVYFKPETSCIDTYFLFPASKLLNITKLSNPSTQVGSTDGKVACISQVTFITNKFVDAYKPYAFMYINDQSIPKFLSFEIKLKHILNPESFLLYNSTTFNTPRYSNLPVDFNVYITSSELQGIKVNQKFNSKLKVKYQPQFALLTDNVTKENIKEHILKLKIANNENLLGKVKILSGKLNIKFSKNVYLTLCLEKDGNKTCVIKNKYYPQNSVLSLDAKTIFEKYNGGYLIISWKFPSVGDTTLYLPYSDLQNAKILHICNVIKPNNMKIDISLDANVFEALPTPVCQNYSYELFKGNILEVPAAKIQYVSLEVIGNGQIKCYKNIGKLYPLYCINIDVSKYRPKDAQNYTFKFIITNAKPEEIVVSSENNPNGAFPVYHKNPYRY